MQRSIPAALVVASLLSSVACSEVPLALETTPSRVSARVTEVIDGDTLRVVTGDEELTVRLIGIDTPESDGPYTDLECYGEEATAFTTEMLDDRDVELEFDVDPVDRYGRTLAYVWLGDDLVNGSILAGGAGVLLTIPPNVLYVDRLRAAQRVARDAERGLWGACAEG